MKKKRKIVLDTETTGINFSGRFYDSHKIIEIGAVEIVDNCVTGNDFHSYICPNRLIEESAFKIHGISNDFLLNKPKFFEIAQNFLKYIEGSELIIHNSKFDVGFINYELSMLDLHIKNILDLCNVTDTLTIARRMFPGKKNTLDALCSRYKISTYKRNIHSAIHDAQLLAKVYIFMTNRQEPLPFSVESNSYFQNKSKFKSSNNINLKFFSATKQDIVNHNAYLKHMIKTSGKCIWINKK